MYEFKRILIFHSSTPATQKSGYHSFMLFHLIQELEIKCATSLFFYTPTLQPNSTHIVIFCFLPEWFKSKIFKFQFHYNIFYYMLTKQLECILNIKILKLEKNYTRDFYQKY